MLLTEMLVTRGRITESDRSKLPKGVLCQGIWPICNIGKLNQNNRMYEEAVIQGRIIDFPTIAEKMKTRTLFGHAEHPDRTQSDLQLTSHIVTETFIKNVDAKEATELGVDEGKIAFQRIEVLDTPCGRIVNTLLEAGCAVGVSTRAEGDLEEVKVKDGKSYQRVVPESYRYVTTDFTADPSTYGTKPISLIRELKEELGSGKLTNEETSFATALLEEVKKIGECVGCKDCKNCGNKKNEEKEFKGFLKNAPKVDKPGDSIILHKDEKDGEKKAEEEKDVKAKQEESKIEESYGNVYIKHDIESGLSREAIVKKITTRYPEITPERAGVIHDKIKKGESTTKEDWDLGQKKQEESVVQEGLEKHVEEVLDDAGVGREHWVGFNHGRLLLAKKGDKDLVMNALTKSKQFGKLTYDKNLHGIDFGPVGECKVPEDKDSEEMKIKKLMENEYTMEEFVKKELIKAGAMVECIQGEELVTGKVESIKENMVLVQLDGGAAIQIAGNVPVSIAADGMIMVSPANVTTATPEVATSEPASTAVDAGSPSPEPPIGEIDVKPEEGSEEVEKEKLEGEHAEETPEEAAAHEDAESEEKEEEEGQEAEEKMEEEEMEESVSETKFRGSWKDSTNSLHYTAPFEAADKTQAFEKLKEILKVKFGDKTYYEPSSVFQVKEACSPASGKSRYKAKAKRMAKHIEKSGKAGGKGEKEAKRIAYATTIDRLGKKGAIKKSHRNEAIDEAQNPWLKGHETWDAGERKKRRKDYKYMVKRAGGGIKTDLQQAIKFLEIDMARKNEALDAIPEFPILESFDDMVEYLKAELPNLAAEGVAKLLTILPTKDLKETAKPSEVQKALRVLKIKEASTRAEAEKALEIIGEVESALEATNVARQVESKAFTKKLSEATTVDSKEVAALREGIEKKVAEMKDLTAKLTEATKAVEDTKKLIETKVKEAADAADKKVITEYINMKVGFSGIKMPSTSRALLEKCTSTKEVDSVFEDVQDAMRRGALHPKSPAGDIVVTEKKKANPDSYEARVDESIGNVMAAMP